MAIHKTKRNDETDVLKELVDDFERVNFGARSLEIVGLELAELNEDMLVNEERKTKFMSNEKLDKKNQVSIEKTAEKLSEKVKVTLPRHPSFSRVPTGRHK